MARGNWIEISGAVHREDQDGVYSAAYQLDEVAARGSIKAADWEQFQKQTGLASLYWRAYWRRRDIIAAGGREKLPSKAAAVVVFMHGWDGCGDIFENLPARVCAATENVLVLVPDVNGFYRSPFREPEKLGYTQCDPQADMQTVESWLEAIGLLGGRRHTPIVLVGHSMSGAALFYFNQRKWSNHRVGRVSLAPALLMNDVLRKGFYNTLGIGIWAGNVLSLNTVTDKLSPLVVDQLIAGASKHVQDVHARVFKGTAKATLANTFAAMGHAKAPSTSSGWENMKVLLGHGDRLVGLMPMLDLLVELGFNSRQVRVLLGDHYFFSVGHHSRTLHAESREITFEEICRVVETVK